MLIALGTYLQAPHRMMRFLVVVAALGAQAVLIGLLLFSPARWAQAVRASVRRSLREASSDLSAAYRAEPRAALLAVAAMTLIGLVTRAYYLSGPMRGDEVDTYFLFVKPSWWVAWSAYPVPNNHLLNTLLARAAILLFGDAAWTLRLPAFIAGVLVIPASYLAARARYSVGAALAATALVTAAAPLIIFSVNARGYTLLLLAFLSGIAIGAYALRTGNVAAWAAYAIVNAMGFFAIPIMLYPFGALTLWLAASARRRQDLVAIALASLGTLLLNADCYAGVIIDGGFLAPTHMHNVAPRSWAMFWSYTPGFWMSYLREMFDGSPRIAVAAIAAGLGLGLIANRRLSAWRVPLLVPVGLWTAFIYVAMHRISYSRIYIFMIVEALIVAGAGLAGWRRLNVRWVSVGSVVAATVLAGFFARSPAMAHSLEFADARAIAQTVGPELRPGDRVITAWWTDNALRYYLVKAGIDTSPLATPRTSALRTIVIAPRSNEPFVLDSLLAADSLGLVKAELPQPTLFPETAVYIATPVTNGPRR